MAPAGLSVGEDPDSGYKTPKQKLSRFVGVISELFGGVVEKGVENGHNCFDIYMADADGPGGGYREKIVSISGENGEIKLQFPDSKTSEKNTAESFLEKSLVTFSTIPYRNILSVSYEFLYRQPVPSRVTENELKQRVYSALDALKDGIGKEDIKRMEEYFFGYPKRLMERLDTEKMPKSSKTVKKSKLERILSKIGGKKEDIDYYEAGEESIEPVVSILRSKDTGRYKLSMFDPRYDDYTKIKDMAMETEICWSDDEMEVLSKSIAKDAVESAGTIIFGVYKNKEPIAFCRDFVCIDHNGNPYLFIDLLEGLGNNHDICTWETDDPGGFKLGLFASVYLAEKMGLDYIAAGDSGVVDLITSLGVSKKRTAIKVGNKKINYKIGLPSCKGAGDTDRNLVKSYFFDDSENYCMSLRIGKDAGSKA